MLAEKFAFEKLQSYLDAYKRFCKKWFGDEIPEDAEKTIRALDIAIDALRNRIPQPVKYNNRHGDGKDYYNQDYFNCPACGRRLRNKKPDPFCPRCGQALSWEVKA